MKNFLISLFVSAVALAATYPVSLPKAGKETQVSDPKFDAATPRFTTDQRGNPVLTWVEKDGDKATFYVAVSTNGGQSFSEKRRVDVPTAISVHAEGMPKLAFKADGTIMALVEVPQPTPESRFAGDLLYVLSSDMGLTWSTPASIHQDTTPEKTDRPANQRLANQRPANRSFSDLIRLPNGEIGLVWLDDKVSGNEGRSVRFMETTPGGGFSREVIVDSNACQCCRTNLFVDTQNRIHLTYRDMLAKVGTEPGARDISHVMSVDGGRTFTKPQVVVADGWKVNACPHTGPALAQVGNDVFATWFSGKEGAIGLRLAKIGDPKLVSALYSERAKHPQVVNANNQLVWLWDESVKRAKPGEDEPPYVQKIALRLVAGQANGSTSYLTPESVNAGYPVALPTQNGLLLAYEQRKGQDNTVIVYQQVALP